MFHFSTMGWFGSSLPRDTNGFVPEDGDDWRDMNWDLPDTGGCSEEEAEDWLDSEWWPEVVAEAVSATARASEALAKWRAC